VKKLLWSPDGSKIAFEWNEFNIKTNTCHGGWYVMNVETGKVNSVGVPWIAGGEFTEGAWRDIDWWPDSKNFFVLQSGKRFGTKGIWFSLINEDGKEESCWEAEGGWIQSPKISPDGTKVAFLGQYWGGRYTGPAFFVKGLKGNKVNYTDSDALLTYPRINVGKEGMTLYSFYWSPDGERIVLSDEISIHLVNADGSNPKRIFNTTKGNSVELIIGWIVEFRSP
jgi:Tol biopolymer transport system component